MRPGSGIRQIVGSAYTNSSIKYPFSEVRRRNKPVRLESIRGLGYNAAMRIREYADAEWPPVWPIFGEVVADETFSYDFRWSSERARDVWVQASPAARSWPASARGCSGRRSLRVIHQALQGCARACKSSLSRPVPVSALPSVASYCAPGGVRGVSGVRGSCFAGSFVLDARVGIKTGCPQPSKFNLRCFRLLHYTGSIRLH